MTSNWQLSNNKSIISLQMLNSFLLHQNLFKREETISKCFLLKNILLKSLNKLHDIILYHESMPCWFYHGIFQVLHKNEFYRIRVINWITYSYLDTAEFVWRKTIMPASQKSCRPPSSLSIPLHHTRKIWHINMSKMHICSISNVPQKHWLNQPGSTIKFRD